jgi:hypothetical protein
MKHAVIVLGLGEAIPVYRFLVHKWQKNYGVTPVIFKVDWGAKDPLDTKLEQLVILVKNLAKKGDVSLIGVSAGASAALNAYQILQKQRIPIRSYISICGRFNLDAYPWYPLSYGVRRSPRFYDSIQRVDIMHNFKNKNATCFFAAFDEVVPTSASTLPHVQSFQIPFILHTPAIYLLLSLRAATLMYRI